MGKSKSKFIPRQIEKTICCGDVYCGKCNMRKYEDFEVRCIEFDVPLEWVNEFREYKRSRYCLAAEQIVETRRKRDVGDAVT